MRAITLALLGWLLVAAGPAMAQAWLTVATVDGVLRFDMPVPFDVPPAETKPDGTVTSSYVRETPDVTLRVEVVRAATWHLPTTAGQFVLASRLVSGDRVEQMRVHVVGRRTYRLIAVSVPELEHDPMIVRFLASMRLGD